MILTTTSVIQGKTVRDYKGIVTGEAIVGANIFRDSSRAFAISLGDVRAPTKRSCRRRAISPWKRCPKARARRARTLSWGSTSTMRSSERMAACSWSRHAARREYLAKLAKLKKLSKRAGRLRCGTWPIRIRHAWSTRGPRSRSPAHGDLHVHARARQASGTDQMHLWRYALYRAYLNLVGEASKYYLGWLWWLLEPMAMTGVFYVVFTYIRSSNIENFTHFLIVGITMWLWFANGVGNCTRASRCRGASFCKCVCQSSCFPSPL